MTADELFEIVESEAPRMEGLVADRAALEAEIGAAERAGASVSDDLRLALENTNREIAQLEKTLGPAGRPSGAPPRTPSPEPAPKPKIDVAASEARNARLKAAREQARQEFPEATKMGEEVGAEFQGYTDTQPRIGRAGERFYEWKDTVSGSNFKTKSLARSEIEAGAAAKRAEHAADQAAAEGGAALERRGVEGRRQVTEPPAAERRKGPRRFEEVPVEERLEAFAEPNLAAERLRQRAIDEAAGKRVPALSEEGAIPAPKTEPSPKIAQQAARRAAVEEEISAEIRAAKFQPQVTEKPIKGPQFEPGKTPARELSDRITELNKQYDEALGAGKTAKAKQIDAQRAELQTQKLTPRESRPSTGPELTRDFDEAMDDLVRAPDKGTGGVAGTAQRAQAVAEQVTTEKGGVLPELLQKPIIDLEAAKVGDQVFAGGKGLKSQAVSGARKGKGHIAQGRLRVVKVNKASVVLEDARGIRHRVPKEEADLLTEGGVRKARVRLTERQAVERQRLQEGGLDRAGSDDIVQMHGGFNPVEILKNAPTEIKKMGVQSGKMLRTEPGKKLGWTLEKRMDPLNNRLQGEMFESFRQAGFNSKANRTIVKGGDLAKQLEGKMKPTELSDNIARLMKQMWVTAKAAGVKVSGRIENYFPRIWKREVAEVVFDDMLAAERKYAMLADMGMADVKRVDDLVELLAKRGDIHADTKEAIIHLMKQGEAKSWAEAWQKLKRQAAEDLFEPYGNIERRRSLIFPERYYERDAAKVLGQYVNSWAKRVAEVKTFGPKGEKALALLDDIRKLDPAEEAIARQIIDVATGKFEKAHRLSRGMEKWVRRFTGFEVATKIGFGFATLKNVFQTLISTATEAGWGRTLVGVAKIAAPTPAGAARRELVRRSGALNKIAWEALTGFRPLSKSGRISEAVLKGTGFHGINVVNQYVAASTAADFVPNLLKIANGKGVINRWLPFKFVKGNRVKWAQAKLKDYGIDWSRPLSEQNLKQAMFRFATDTQLQKNILRDPLLANHPAWRPLYLFKRFGLRQFHYIKDLMKREVSLKNPMPLFRLAAGGALGGVAEQWSERRIRHLLTGQPMSAEDKVLFEHIKDGIASIGAWSIITDIIAAEDKVRAGIFFVTPIQLQELENGRDALVRFWNDMDVDAVLDFEEPIPTRPVPEILHRQIKTSGRFLGTFPREFAKRLETESQTQGRESFLKGRTRDDIFRALWRGDRKKANRLRKKWNTEHPKNRLKHSDVAADDFYQWKVRRGKAEKKTGKFEPPSLAFPAPEAPVPAAP
jgi:hypothetical protein